MAVNQEFYILVRTIITVLDQNKPQIVSQKSHKKRIYIGSYKNKNGRVPVKVEIRSKNSRGEWNRERISTGVHVKPENWAGKEGKWIGRGEAQYLRKNEELYRVLEELDTEDYSREKLEFIPFAESFIELCHTSKIVGYRRIQDYKNTVRILLEFEKEKGYPLMYDTINMRFISLFLGYLEKTNHSQNNRRKVLKIIKRFLRVALNEGYHTNLHFTTDAWSVKEVLSEEVYLNAAHIEQLEQLELSGVDERNRDVIVLGCNVGLRYSDLAGLAMGNVVKHRDRKMIRCIQAKTNEVVVIPVNSTVARIIDKYDGFPTMINRDKFSAQMKILCAKIGFEKHKLVSSHTMRRSFATNAFISGVPAHSIMKITGHKTESSFLRYIRITNEETASLIGDHEFFR